MQNKARIDKLARKTERIKIVVFKNLLGERSVQNSLLLFD